MNTGLIFHKRLGRYVPELERVLLLEGFHELEGDDMARPDSDSDVLEATWHVQSVQEPSVRVTIPHDVDPKVAARLLKKIAEWFESNPDLVADARPFIVTKPMGNEAKLAKPSDDFGDHLHF